MSRQTIKVVEEICADCGAFDPNWASVNRGILICDDCCCIHRGLGRHISQVKSLKKSVWSPTLLQMVKDLYSSGANSIWEYTMLDPLTGKSGGRKKPCAKDSLIPNKSEFIRAKHQNLTFINRGTKEESESDISEQLHSSVRTPNLKTSLRLLAAGANPNYIHNEKYNSPLHMAAKAGQMSQIELLIVYGANPLIIDVKGKTPIDYARDANYSDIVERLIECQYELSDRLTYFLCNRTPNHRNSQHYLIPELADSNIATDHRVESKAKLRALSNRLFEETARDVYDEVDRREIDSVCQSQSPSIHDRQIVPFLPVNHEYSPIRNQGRQKLARFSPREFATLIVDILSEIRYRVHGMPQIGTAKSNAVINAKLDPNKRVNASVINDNNDSECDSEPLYDSVPSEDEEDVTQNSLKVSTIKRSIQTSPDNKNELKDAKSSKPVSMGEYCVLKDQLSRSDCLIQELVHSNKDMRHEITRLQIMVQKLYDENDQLRAIVIPKTPDNNIDHRNVGSSDGPPPVIMPRTLNKFQNRPQSMYERPSPHAQSTPSSNSMASLNTIVPHHCSVSSSSSHVISDNKNKASNLDSVTGAEFDSKSKVSSLPSKDEIFRKTEQITRRIQELLGLAQEGRHELFDSCAERIIESVTDMISIFPESSLTNAEHIMSALRQLRNSALQLKFDCRVSPFENPENHDYRVLYQQVIQRAYDIAKSTKYLITMFQ